MSEDLLLVERILNAGRAFDGIDVRAHAWATSPSAGRRHTYEVNRQWFRANPVCESSVFLYFDLSGNHAAVERAAQVQGTVEGIVGKGNLNPAPPSRLHSTILTDVVATRERLGGDRVWQVAQKYANLFQDLPPCLLFVLGPHLTPGGIILECRVHEPAVFRLREAARSLADDRGSRPRIPAVEYATLGYLTGGDTATLIELQRALGRIRADSSPLAVPVDRVFVTLTVNKAIMPPTVGFASTAGPIPRAASSASLFRLDPEERAMLHESVRFASASP